MHRRVVAVAASVLILAGCAETTSPGAAILQRVHAAISPSELARGEVGILTIGNDAAVPISVGLCEVLEHDLGGRWEEVSDPGRPNCDEGLREIRAGATFSLSIRPIPAGALPGSYRLRLDAIAARDESGRLVILGDVPPVEFTVR